MKVKVTKKDIKNNYSNIIKVGYCGLQDLLKATEGADYYSAGAYGWACDYYVIDNNTIICTGYSAIGNIEDYSLSKKYNDMAKDFINDGFVYNHNKGYDYNYIKRQKRLKKMLDKYINEMINK